jgi:hypothetical protein
MTRAVPDEASNAVMAQKDYPPDIWETATRIAQWVDPSDVLETDPTPAIAFALWVERQVGPPPSFYENMPAENYQGEA